MTMWQSAVYGARSSGGFFVSTFLFGIMFGLAVSAAGINGWQGLLMSGAVFSASAQFAALEFWQSPLPYGAIALSVLLVSARNVLLGLSVSDQFDGYSLPRRMLHLFLLNDPGVVTVFALDRNIDRLGYVTGYGVVLWISWICSTAFGYSIAGMVGNDIASSFGFAGPLVMAAMMVLFIKGTRSRHLPWMVSGITALMMTALDATYYSILPVSVVSGVLAGVGQVRTQKATEAGL